MVKEIFNVILGSICWAVLKIRDNLNYSKIVLVLSGENGEVDRFAISYIDMAIERKRADSAIIYVMDEKSRVLVQEKLRSNYHVVVKRIPKKVIDLIYRRYMLDKFYKNIFWTYTDKTKNNLLGRFMRETDINAEDVVCLAIYNFRQVPNKVVVKNVCG